MTISRNIFKEKLTRLPNGAQHAKYEVESLLNDIQRHMATLLPSSDEAKAYAKIQDTLIATIQFMTNLGKRQELFNSKEHLKERLDTELRNVVVPLGIVLTQISACEEGSKLQTLYDNAANYCSNAVKKCAEQLGNTGPDKEIKEYLLSKMGVRVSQ